MQNIPQQELAIINGLLQRGYISSSDLPKGIWVGLDSMGPARDPKTDTLFDGIPQALHDFTQTMNRYDLGLLLATNGPDKEGEEILRILNRDSSPRAFAVTEGGGKILYFENGSLNEKVLAIQEELADLSKLEERVKQDSPLMKVLLEDTEPDGQDAPMRTPYHTNIVVTLPNQYPTFRRRLEAKGISVGEFIPDIREDNYIDGVLNYSRGIFVKTTQDMGLTNRVGSPILKVSNRRIYVPVQNVYQPGQNGQNLVVPLSKNGGAVAGSEFLSRENGYPPFDLNSSIYVADNVIDVTRREGNLVLGSSERSMVKNNGKQAKMAFNVTMGEQLPGLERVEGVKVLNVGSGVATLYIITHLYNSLHK